MIFLSNNQSNVKRAAYTGLRNECCIQIPKIEIDNLAVVYEMAKNENLRCK